jgi:DNA (cytosine-5)-methyltransferase 1
MGYKLAGYRVLGGVEIDPHMMELYRANHRPEHSYLMGVQEFKGIAGDLPQGLRDIDVLDGSPPCSSFSMAGSREDAWGDAKRFREGQVKQVLDDLFFHFIDIAERMRPKAVIAENVKGLIIGKARGYVKEIFEAFRRAGYDCQLFLLNSSRMGVPQSRERTFFVARRTDLALPRIELPFAERPISVREAWLGLPMDGLEITAQQAHWWHRVGPGQAFSKGHPKGHWFTAIKLHPDRPAPTLCASDGNAGFYLWDKPRRTDSRMLIRAQSFPEDYAFLGVKPQYLLGMSVPPFMMQRVADQVLRQWLLPLRVR